MFTGLLEPWRGVLLHGPPGTGKTQLARAVADQSQCTFFNITCGTVVNKWRGESEKIIKVPSLRASLMYGRMFCNPFIIQLHIA